MRLRRLLATSPYATPDSLGDPVHDRLVAVGVVDRVDLLQDPRRALEAHARVDVLLRQRRQRPVGVQLELHEDEVPELEEAVALAARRAVGPAAADAPRPSRSRSPSRARTARGRRPTRSCPRAAAGRSARGGMPDPSPSAATATSSSPSPSSGSPAKTRHPDPVAVELHVLEDELPGELDRAVLEVLAEREVAEHLEERQVVAVEADLVDVGRPEDFCTVVSERRGRLLRGRGRTASAAASRPRSSSVERSSARGISERRGPDAWPFDSKKAR